MTNTVTLNNILYLSRFLNGFLMISWPVFLAIIITRKFHLGWRLFWIGGATFILSQVFHIPFNNFVTGLFQRGILPRPASWILPYFNPIFLGLSAGIFEETARYLMYRFWAKDARSWSKGLLAGAGHGGVEAIVLGIYVLYVYAIMVAARAGAYNQSISPSEAETLQQQINAYWSVPVYLSLFGALERFFTVPFQIACSIIVLQVFTRKNLLWLPAAILWHALSDAWAVYASVHFSIPITEAGIGVFALLSVGIIFGLRQPEPSEPQPVELPPVQPIDFHPTEVPVTEEKLDDTRYNL